MKVLRNIWAIIFFYFGLIVSFSSCTSEPKWSPPKSGLPEYIISHTKKNIKPSEQVFVRFNLLGNDLDKIGKGLARGVIKLKPSVKGEFVWKDAQTAVFMSEQPLDYNSEYLVIVDYSKLFDGIKASVYSFSFNTEQFYFNVERTIFKPTFGENDHEFYLAIDVTTNADINENNIDDFLRIEENDSKPSFSNFVKNASNKYSVECGPFEKTGVTKQISINWNLENQSTKFEGSRNVEVPAKGLFTIMSVDLVSGGKGHIRVMFSNVIKKQNFEGLVKLLGYAGEYRFASKMNQLDIYVDSDIQGKYRLLLDKSILDFGNKSLKELKEIELNFLSPFPAIRTTEKGSIVPFKEEVIFPFEAIALDTVEIQVFKVFENNVMDFLRYSDLNDTYIEDFFGRNILNKKIALSEISNNPNQLEWVRYALDLQQLTSLDPGAIYKVKIGFKKSYSNYQCSDENVHASTSEDNASAFDTYDYYHDYSYEHNEDPCYAAYYNYNRFIERNLLASNVGLIVKKGKTEELRIFATNLNTGEPFPDIELKYFDRQQQLIYTNKTDGQGMANLGLGSNVEYVIAKSIDGYAYLALQDNRSNALATFDVSGVSLKEGLNGYLFGERGVWRPGDTLHMTYMLYDKKKSISSSHPVNLKIKDSKGKLKYDGSTIENENGIYVYHVPTSTSDPTGLWTATATVGNFITSARLKIETIKPNRIKVDLNFKDAEIDVSENEKFLLKAEWMHGAPASELKAEVDIKYENRLASFENYQKYNFNDPARLLENSMSNLFSGTVDTKGEKEITIPFGNEFKPPGKLSAQLRTRIFEKSGNYSEDYNSVNISPYKSYAGVKIPESRWGGKLLNVSDNEKVDFVCVDNDGKPIRGRKLSIGFYRADWSWWYHRGETNIYKYNTSEHYEAIDKTTILTDAKGRIEYEPELDGHGRYLVRVCDTESGHCSGELFYTDNYSRSNDEEGEVAQLNFETNKSLYKPGESISIEVPTNENSNLLVSVENNEKVLDAFWVEATGNLTTIPLKATAEMWPNAYLHVTLIQGTENGTDLPLRLYGVKSLQIEDPATILLPAIHCTDEFEPNSKVEITVSESQGKSMSYTLAIVDEGLLDITNFKTPDPKKHFFAKQALGVKSWDLFDFVLNRHGGEIEKIFGVGGDGTSNQEVENPSANRFKSIVKFLGPFTIDKGKSNKHSFDIPNYVGSVRLMVVAKSDKAFGQSERNVLVRKPLMVLSTLPRVLAPGESLDVPVNVFSYNDDIKNVSVVAKSDNLMTAKSKTTNVVKFSRQGDELTFFAYKVGSETGIAHFKFDVSAGNYSAHDEVEIDVRNPSPEISEVTSQLVSKGSTWTNAFANIGTRGTNNAILEISKFPSFDFSRRMAYLVRYPYGCIEQTTSSVFPQLYLDDFATLDSKEQNKIVKNIEAGIRRLMHFQTNNGGFSYWPGSSANDKWGTNYAGHFLVLAREKGYFVQESIFENWKKFQKQESDRYSHGNEKYLTHDQAYRLYTLALADAPNLSAMNRLRVQDNLPKLAQFLLAAAYAKIGQKEIAKKIIAGLDFSIEAYNEMSGTFGSTLRDKAILLLTLLDMGERKDAFNLANEIGKNLSSQNWYNTQATSFALLSLSKFLSTQSDGKMSYSYTFDNDSKVSFQSNEALDIYTLDLSKKENHNFVFINESEVDLYVRVCSNGKPLPQPSPSYEKGLKMTVDYYNDEGLKIDPKELRQGQDFKAKITVTNVSKYGQNYEHLALNHTLPSGWEIQNLRIGGINEQDNDAYDHQDIRDDRIYTFFSLSPKRPKVFVANLTATYTGEFFMPNITCEAMYDKEVSVSREGAWVKVIR